jgi:hypothetical protein
MDPCSIDDIVVIDYTVGVAEIVAPLEIVLHLQTVA